MRKLAVVAGLLLLLASPLATVEAAGRQQAGQVTTDIEEKSDRVKGYACDCCQKCQAARRPVVPQEETGPARKANGCKECCDRCGLKMPPTPDEIPPDVIEKEVPPEVKDKQRR